MLMERFVIGCLSRFLCQERFVNVSLLSAHTVHSLPCEQLEYYDIKNFDGQDPAMVEYLIEAVMCTMFIRLFI